MGEIKIKVDSLNDISDGFHTIQELYDHRCLLWINLVNMQIDKSYLIEEHFEGWFLLGLESDQGQISYHCPNKYLKLVNKKIKKLTDDSIYDGHT